MPNGKPGDHWFSDVLHHETPTFTPRIDALIRELGGGRGKPRYEPLIELVERHIGGRMWETLTAGEHEALERDLEVMRRQIRST